MKTLVILLLVFLAHLPALEILGVDYSQPDKQGHFILGAATSAVAMLALDRWKPDAKWYTRAAVDDDGRGPRRDSQIDDHPRGIGHRKEIAHLRSVAEQGYGILSGDQFFAEIPRQLLAQAGTVDREHA